MTRVAIHVTANAIDRYRERVADIAAEAVVERLSGPVFLTACRFGARLVKLPEGGTAVLNFTPDGPSVVTVMGKAMRCSLHFPESHGGRPNVGELRGI